MSTLGRARTATAGQFAGVFGPNTSPPRRDDAGEPGDPGPEIPAEAPDGPPLTSPTRPASVARPAPTRAATRRAATTPARPTRSAAAAAAGPRAGDRAAWRNVTEDARRVVAAAARLDERSAELATSVARLLSTGAEPIRVAGLLLSLGIAVEDMPEDLAEQVSRHQ
jgi:hypothetical protein